jgi:hypothetical protein
MSSQIPELGPGAHPGTWLSGRVLENPFHEPAD